MTGLRLSGLRDRPLSVDEVLAAVGAQGHGGVVVFLGVVRDSDEGRRVRSLDYTAHPTAAAELERVGAEVAARHPGCGLAAVHRVGALRIGDLAVVVAAAASHRAAAFAAARDLIDTVKDEVPIWKEQEYDDGSTHWVGSP